MIKRKQNWHNALNDCIKEYRNKTFSYGKSDCCLFSADVIKAITNVDVMADIRGKYTTEIEAQKKIKIAGGLEQLLVNIAKKYELSNIEINKAKRGDLIFFDYEDEQFVGICIGEKIISMSKIGVAFISMKHALIAWGI